MSMANIDITGIPEAEVTVGQCEVIDLGTAIAPTAIIVELPDSDGARVAARWLGHPDIDVGDFVRIQRRRDDPTWEVITTSSGTASAAMPQTPLTGSAGWLVNDQGILLRVA